MSMKSLGDSIWPVGRRSVTPTALRKFSPLGDNLAAVTPPKESYTENLPPMSMSPTWERPTDCSGLAAIPKAGSVRIRCASRKVSRLWEAKGPLVVIAGTPNAAKEP